MRIIQGPHFKTGLVSKTTVFFQGMIRSPDFLKEQNEWIAGTGAAAAVGLTLTDVDMMKIGNEVNKVETEYSGRGPNTVIEKKEDTVGDYIIKKLIDDNATVTIGEENQLKLINKAKPGSKIKATLATAFGYEIAGGRRAKKSKKSKKSKKTRKARKQRQSQRNSRRSQRNRN